MRVTTLVSVLALALTVVAGGQQLPTVEYGSLLRTVKVYPDNGIIAISGEVIFAFMPDDVLYDGYTDAARNLYVSVWRGSEMLMRAPMTVENHEGVFSLGRSAGSPLSTEVTQAGDYALAFDIEVAKVMAMPFTIRVNESGDPFNPARTYFADGRWSELAYLELPHNSQADAHLNFIVWGRSEDRSPRKFRVRVRYEGRDLFVSREMHVASPHWSEVKMPLAFPEAAGGDFVSYADFTKQDGRYDMVVECNGEPYGVYPVDVKDGKPVMHPRSAFGHRPHDDYLCSRRPVFNQGRAGADLVWTAPLSSGAADAARSNVASAAAGPTPENIARWTVDAEAPADRPVELLHTKTAVRMDAGLAAGDGIIAYGTGSNTGVSYLTTRDGAESTIPDGQTYSSSVFFACSKKIVLVNPRELGIAVYDTLSQQMTSIPANEIKLARGTGDLYSSKMVFADGYLVVTANDSSKVDDRAVIKVVDVSGAQPVVFGIGNAEFLHREVTSVAIDAETGMLAVASKRKNAIYTSAVSPGASFTKHDLAGHDGVADAQILVDNGFVAYRDAAGTSKFRLLEIATGSVHTLDTIGGYGTCYTVHDGRYAVATAEGSGSDYVHVGGVLPAEAKPLANTGEAMQAGNGMLGMGQSIAIAPDGTMFIAGRGKGGLGSGEFLQIALGDRWIEIPGPDGKALPAADVVMGERLIAFKTGKRNDTTVSFLRIGDRVRLP